MSENRRIVVFLLSICMGFALWAALVSLSSSGMCPPHCRCATIEELKALSALLPIPRSVEQTNGLELTMTDRKKPGVAFWATLGLVAVLVGYPLSFGPACWAAGRTNDYGRGGLLQVIRFYPIITSAAFQGPKPVANSLKWWAAIGARGHTVAMLEYLARRDGIVHP